ncbi:predicted protein [Naegleria gruberi]|uniref:Predicted protein n=1 Tax=Naegleria gruberi TaxID=5762 RepID=D2V0E2_NAEGR|nr:uncharacterized protein NAEGRDRAFT_45675 [Naegleria gruberi]EFC49509.1 predicted protein [Naegleria gruberi]|eukprot:XP_002682253.1 predicted protein [Naegleria gruberi strain NEG-M]
MGNDKSKGFLNSANSADKDELDKTIEKLKGIEVSSMKFYPIKLNGKEKNQNLLFPKEVIMEMAINYLEIRDMHKLAMTCKLLYNWLFSDANEFWRRVGERDGFSDKSGEEIQKIYANLWKQCFDFENHQYFENCLQSKMYTYSNSHSYNYENFMKFLDGINRDINQMIYVLRNPKRNIILRAYIAVYGLWDHTKGEELDEKLEKIFRTLCFTEDGTELEAIIDWQSTKVCNLLSITMDMNLQRLNSDQVKERIEDLFLQTAAFRVDCSGFTKYYRFAEGQLSERANKLLSNRYQTRESNPKWCEYYDLLLRVLTTPEIRKTIHSIYSLESIMQYFQSFKREESIDIIIDLLRSNELFKEEQTIGYITCKSLAWDHPRIFEELMNERYYSNECSYIYANLIGRYIYTNSQEVNVDVRKRALNHISFICKNKKHINEIADTFIYYLPWKKLKEFTNFQWTEFKEEALKELKECTYYMWTYTQKVSFLPILTDFYAEEQDRTINQLLSLKPLSGRDTSHYIVEEAFRILKNYAERIQLQDYDSYFPRLIEYLKAYILNPDCHNNDCTIKEIVKAAEWIQPKYSIEKLYGTMKKASETSSFIQYYVKDGLPSIELIMNKQ